MSLHFLNTKINITLKIKIITQLRDNRLFFKYLNNCIFCIN